MWVSCYHKHPLACLPSNRYLIGASNLFSAGKAAIMLDGTWQVGYMRSIKKDVNFSAISYSIYPKKHVTDLQI
jgi:ABC-type glycerol-3-phosphate transport system substrate-binding protein